MKTKQKKRKTIEENSNSKQIKTAKTNILLIHCHGDADITAPTSCMFQKQFLRRKKNNRRKQ